ncbi:MAG: GTPase ObgE [Myxococcales bacterium]|nr:GTPase ObgE [Myxococcales bacterium]
MRFVDRVRIRVRGGDGGAGMISFMRTAKNSKGGPDGGDGGRGGDIILVGSRRLETLLDLRLQPQQKAENGRPGGRQQMTGGNARPVRIPVPLGTQVYSENEQGEREFLLGELLEEDQELRVAEGGIGGKGNARFASSRRRRPDFALAPGEGETVSLQLELKLIADVGLLGMPNAGKSTLIRAVSNARPEVADYPFTTKVPNLGIARSPAGDLVIADIPGLIEGAAEGHGLGHQFLRHVERVRVLAHLVTLPAHEAERGLAGLLEDLELIEAELKAYNDGHLAERPRLVVLSQIDQPWLEELKVPFLEAMAERGLSAVACSGMSRLGCDQFLLALAKLLDPVKPDDADEDHFDPSAGL